MRATVLDKGFVRLEDFMGGDRAVIRSARVSYGKDVTDEDRDKKLIAYLLKHKHGTPFEHAVFQFHVKCPIFVMRQWIRHRMASYNETSARYREMPNEFYFPEEFRAQDTKNKQGSTSGNLARSHNYLRERVKYISEESMEIYHEFLRDGVAREMARLVLPVNLYTEFYWTVNARSLMNFISLRSDSHAQWEIRQFSHQIAMMFAAKMPFTWAALMEQVLHGSGYDELRRVFYFKKTDAQSQEA